MKYFHSTFSAVVCAGMLIGAHGAAAQTSSQKRQPVIDVRVSRTIQAVTYRANTSTQIDFRGTPLVPRAEGKARVEAKSGRVEIKAEFDNLEPASTFGRAYLTYVLWAISPEGQANNLGELLLDGRKSQLNATTKLQSFGMIVTAEPYFAVTLPSDAVVIENIARKDTKGAITEVDAKYDLLQRGRYEQVNLEPYAVDDKTPLALHEARNAVRIAEAQGAAEFAPESWAKAQSALAQTEDYYRRKQKQPVLTASRNTVQAAEDARSIAVKRAQEDRIARERQATEEEAKRAHAQQEAEAERAKRANEQAAQAQAGQQVEEQRRRDAEQQRMQAELAAAKEGQARAEAEAQRQSEAKARADAEAQRQAEALRAQQAQQQAEESGRQAQQAQEQAARSENEKQELRETLLAQFNQILETRDTPRGLIVNVGDVLFDPAKYTLKSPAREALARLSGIVVNYPGLKLQVEGHTDSRGSDDFNQKLSEERAGTVRSYLVAQGVKSDSVEALGLGPNLPVADNSTAEGRQRNRRVEIIISGEVIGSQVGGGRR
jgi:outer membrane protein OmpA-like peptidoglycan-associated protein